MIHHKRYHKYIRFGCCFEISSHSIGGREIDVRYTCWGNALSKRRKKNRNIIIPVYPLSNGLKQRNPQLTLELHQKMSVKSSQNDKFTIILYILHSLLKIKNGYNILDIITYYVECESFLIHDFNKGVVNIWKFIVVESLYISLYLLTRIL